MSQRTNPNARTQAYPAVDRVTRLDRRTRGVGGTDRGMQESSDTLQLGTNRRSNRLREGQSTQKRRSGEAIPAYPRLSNGPTGRQNAVNYKAVKTQHDVPDAIPPKDPSNLDKHAQRHASLGARGHRKTGSASSGSSGDTADGSSGLMGKVKKLIS